MQADIDWDGLFAPETDICGSTDSIWAGAFGPEGFGPELGLGLGLMLRLRLSRLRRRLRLRLRCRSIG